jgi:hypothetical protein
MGELSAYEQRALAEVEPEKQRKLAKSPRRLVPAKVKTIANKAGNRARDVPGADKAAQAAARGYAKAAEGMGKLMARSSQFTLSDHRVLRAYRRKGHLVQALSDIHDLDLQVLDTIARFKRVHHPRDRIVLSIQGAPATAAAAELELDAVFCPLTSAKRRQFCSRSCATKHARRSTRSQT